MGVLYPIFDGSDQAGIINKIFLNLWTFIFLFI